MCYSKLNLDNCEVDLKDYSDMQDWSPKRLRTLRNNLNNRISSMKTGTEKKLGENHPLFGLELGDCNELLERVLRLIKDSSK